MLWSAQSSSLRLRWSSNFVLNMTMNIFQVQVFHTKFGWRRFRDMILNRNSFTKKTEEMLIVGSTSPLKQFLLLQLVLIKTAAGVKNKEETARFASFQAQRARPARGGSVAIWRSRGELVDPASGKMICRVEGLEATKVLENGTVGIARRYRYVDPGSGSALTKFKRRAVRQPESYTSIVSQRLLEDGRTVEVQASVGGRSIAPMMAAFTATEEASRLDTYVNPDGKRPAEPRLVGISAKGPTTPSLSRAQRGLRCRESYTVVSDTAASYSRFGECPAWFGPGKLCALDLNLRKLDLVAHSLPNLDDDQLFQNVLENAAPIKQQQPPQPLQTQSEGHVSFASQKEYLRSIVGNGLQSSRHFLTSVRERIRPDTAKVAAAVADAAAAMADAAAGAARSTEALRGKSTAVWERVAETVSSYIPRSA